MLRIYGIRKQYIESTNLYLETYIQPIQKINEILRTSNDITMTEATIHDLKSIANYSDSCLKKNNTLIFDRLSNHLFLFLFSTKYLMC